MACLLTYSPGATKTGCCWCLLQDELLKLIKQHCPVQMYNPVPTLGSSCTLGSGGSLREGFIKTVDKDSSFDEIIHLSAAWRDHQDLKIPML